jgi:hypothetical protein
LPGKKGCAFKETFKQIDSAKEDDFLYLVKDRDPVSLMKLPQWKTILAKYKVPVPKL